jgi:UDP-N-acetylmuramate dehydrogenase
MAMTSDISEYIRSVAGKENVFTDEPMSRHTTFRTGGPADCFVRVTGSDELAELIAHLKAEDVPFFVTGNGSNLLVSDDGYRGVILSTMGMNHLETDGNRITAGAGVLCSRIAAEALEHELTGMAALAGIPGTIGGGVCMNAGAYGSEMKDVVELVEAVTPEGKKVYLSNEQMKFEYRNSAVKKLGLTVTEVVIKLWPGERSYIEEDMADYALRRREKQPLEYPSAGSTFKRPEGNYAGKLIEEAGLKGYSQGDAGVSEKHCGFIINKGNASSSDIYSVIRHVQEEVGRKSGIHLETEVVLLGRF